ncbi:unnamed protein product [Trichogramma brassicae]|nr:unnamed protein product [Trichogramma brassicae]CAB0040054.1 unnamed protein product [Trichogramma brassicae]CAB0040057.1 unnamed protein product [Trichogramma brassicae]
MPRRRRLVMLSDSPPVRCIEKPPPTPKSYPLMTPSDPPSAQLPTKRPVIQVLRPLRRAVVLSDSPSVRCIEKPKSLYSSYLHPVVKMTLPRSTPLHRNSSPHPDSHLTIGIRYPGMRRPEVSMLVAQDRHVDLHLLHRLH